MTNTSISFLRQEEKLRKVDAKKAAQVERLGMGASSSKAGIGHSVMNQMNTIVQVIYIIPILVIRAESTLQLQPNYC